VRAGQAITLPFYRGNMIKRIADLHGSGSVGIQIQRAIGKGEML
jgi:hypothetical protein